MRPVNRTLSIRAEIVELCRCVHGHGASVARPSSVKIARRSLGCGLIALLAPRAASAHTKLVAAIPSDGADLDRSPERIVLRFSSAVERRFSRIAIVKDGASTDLVVEGAGSGGRARELSALLPALASGAHLVRWDVVAADGHRIAGTVRFRIRS